MLLMEAPTFVWPTTNSLKIGHSFLERSRRGHHFVGPFPKRSSEMDVLTPLHKLVEKEAVMNARRVQLRGAKISIILRKLMVKTNLTLKYRCFDPFYGSNGQKKLFSNVGTRLMDIGKTRFYCVLHRYGSKTGDGVGLYGDVALGKNPTVFQAEIN